MTRRSDRRGTSLVCAALELIGGARLHSFMPRQISERTVLGDESVAGSSDIRRRYADICTEHPFCDFCAFLRLFRN
jgi:hypothetical protein